MPTERSADETIPAPALNSLHPHSTTSVVKQLALGFVDERTEEPGGGKRGEEAGEDGEES